MEHFGTSHNGLGIPIQRSCDQVSNPRNDIPKPICNLKCLKHASFLTIHTQLLAHKSPLQIMSAYKSHWYSPHKPYKPIKHTCMLKKYKKSKAKIFYGNLDTACWQ